MSELKYLKPIMLLDGRAFRPERLAVIDAIVDIFMACRFPAIPPVADYGCWRHPQYIDPHGYMVPFMSVAWYIAQAREPSRERLNAQRVMAAFRQEPWRRDDSLGDHYDILLVDQPLYDPAEEEHFGLTTTPGYAVPGIAAVLSTHDTDRLDRVSYSLLKTVAIRELAHAFGVPGFRRDCIELTPRISCTNPCVLGPCIEMPDDLETLTHQRLAGPPFCDACIVDLRTNLERGMHAEPEG